MNTEKKVFSAENNPSRGGGEIYEIRKARSTSRDDRCFQYSGSNGKGTQWLCRDFDELCFDQRLCSRRVAPGRSARMLSAPALPLMRKRDKPIVKIRGSSKDHRTAPALAPNSHRRTYVA